jgi:HD-like signal output (HDOD) protein
VPSLVLEITEAADREDFSLHDVAKLISQDMGMSVEVLRLVNSPYFGLPNQISSIEQAVSLLGLDIIRTLIISVQFFESFNGLEQKDMDVLLKHSLNCAFYCKAIYEYEEMNLEECNTAFIAGFMHDLGRLILLSTFPAKFIEGQVKSVVNGDYTAKVEMAQFGVSHSDVSAFMLGLWGFSDEVIEAVAFHHNPLKAMCEKPLLLAVLHCSDVFEYEINGSGGKTSVDPLSVEFLEKCNLLDKEEEWLEVCVKSER